MSVMPSYADDRSAPLIVSLYRKNLDPGYQWMIWSYAEEGYFDELFIEVLMDVIRNGKSGNYYYSIFVLPHSIPFLGVRNMDYLVAVQSTHQGLAEPSVHTVSAAGMLGQPERARLTSFNTCHFLDMYF